MSAIMKIDQVGLSAGINDRARTDGLASGALVTLTSTGGGTTAKFRLLWVPPTDTTAVSSLVPVSVTTWTFSPTPAAYGSYRIELIVDEGLPTEERSIRTFAIRTPNLGLVIPSLNEIASPSASLVNSGNDQIDASESNEAFSPFISGSYVGWWRFLNELILSYDANGGGGVAPLYNFCVINGGGTPFGAVDFADALVKAQAFWTTAPGTPFSIYMNFGSYAEALTTSASCNGPLSIVGYSNFGDPRPVLTLSSTGAVILGAQFTFQNIEVLYDDTAATGPIGLFTVTSGPDISGCMVYLDNARVAALGGSTGCMFIGQSTPVEFRVQNGSAMGQFSVYGGSVDYIYTIFDGSELEQGVSVQLSASNSVTINWNGTNFPSSNDGSTVSWPTPPTYVRSGSEKYFSSVSLLNQAFNETSATPTPGDFVGSFYLRDGFIPDTGNCYALMGLLAGVGDTAEVTLVDHNTATTIATFTSTLAGSNQISMSLWTAPAGDTFVDIYLGVTGGGGDVANLKSIRIVGQPANVGQWP